MKNARGHHNPANCLVIEQASCVGPLAFFLSARDGLARSDLQSRAPVSPGPGSATGPDTAPPRHRHRVGVGVGVHLRDSRSPRVEGTAAVGEGVRSTCFGVSVWWNKREVA